MTRIAFVRAVSIGGRMRDEVSDDDALIERAEGFDGWVIYAGGMCTEVPASNVAFVTSPSARGSSARGFGFTVEDARQVFLTGPRDAVPIPPCESVRLTQEQFDQLMGSLGSSGIPVSPGPEHLQPGPVPTNPMDADTADLGGEEPRVPDGQGPPRRRRARPTGG